GLIAFEMAQQLQARGEEIQFLAIINAHARNAAFRPQKKLADWVGRVFGLTPDREMDLFIRLRNFTAGLRESAQGGTRAVVRKSLGKLKAAFFPARMPSDKDEAQAGMEKGTGPAVPMKMSIERHRHYGRIVAGYMPENYRGRITLLRTADAVT